MRIANNKKPSDKKPTSKHVSILFILGVLFVSSAGVYSYIEQRVDFLSAVLLLLGVITLLFCFSYDIKLSHYSLGTRSWKARLKAVWNQAAVFIVVMSLSIVFIVSVNYFAHHSSYRWDVTRDNQHTLSQTTINFVAGIEQPLELTAFYVGLPPKYLEDLLNEYKRVSNGKITVNIVDPIEDIAYAAKFGNVISGTERKLIVVAGDERKDIDFSEAALSEEQITNTLARVTREARQVYFLTGHGELSEINENNQGLSLFAALLNLNNISSDSLMLGTVQKIPDDCDVLIVAGPRTDLTAKEYALIEDYLQLGGDALFLIEAVAAKGEATNPSLNTILNQWGIHVGDDMVVDLSSHVGDDFSSPATRNYVDHKAITEGLDYTFYIRPRSIAVVNDRRATIKLAPIVLSASKGQSWAETDRNLTVDFDAGVDTPGPVPISYVIWEKKEEGDESDTRIIAFTDADFLSNVYLNQYSNAALGLNVVNWLSELDYTVLLNQKKAEVERLDLTSKQKRMIASLLFLMPLFIAVAGFCVWIRRRY